MSLAFLFNVPIKTKFQVAGTKNTKDLLEAFLGDFIPGEAEGVILELDATITQNHVLTSEVTEHPLDDNTSFSDHIILRPRQLSIEGTITDTPVQFLSVFQTGTIGNIFGGKLQPSLESWQTLVNELWYSRTPFDIVTSKDFYKNVVPISISSARNNKTGRQNRFMMEVKYL